MRRWRGRTASLEPGVTVERQSKSSARTRMGPGVFFSQHAPNGKITCCFHARDLHLVMGPWTPGGSVQFLVLLDGQPPPNAQGSDVDEHGNGVTKEQRLHQVIREREPIVDRQFGIEFLDEDVEAFAFTFG